MDRPQVRKNLDAITEMSDQEIANNAGWIREVAGQAGMHISQLIKKNIKAERKAKA